VDRKDIIQAGNSNSLPPTWGAEELIATENSTVKQYINTYAHHNYPGGTIQSLMTHSTTVSNIHRFDADVAAALRIGKPYVFGETNSGKLTPRQPIVIDTDIHYLYSLRRWSCGRVADIWCSAVDDGLLSPSDIQQHVEDILPPRNCRELPILLLGQV
jgi:hypothetical protein